MTVSTNNIAPENLEFEFTATKTEIDGRRNEVDVEITHEIEINFEAFGEYQGSLNWSREQSNGITEDVEQFSFLWSMTADGKPLLKFHAEEDLSELFALPRFLQCLSNRDITVAPHWSIPIEFTCVEFIVSIVKDDAGDKRCDTLEEARDACDTPTFHGLGCYIYGVDRFGTKTYIEHRLCTETSIITTTLNGKVDIEDRPKPEPLPAPDWSLSAEVEQRVVEQADQLPLSDWDLLSMTPEKDYDVEHIEGNRYRVLMVETMRYIIEIELPDDEVESEPIAEEDLCTECFERPCTDDFRLCAECEAARQLPEPTDEEKLVERKVDDLIHNKPRCRVRADIVAQAIGVPVGDDFRFGDEWTPYRWVGENNEQFEIFHKDEWQTAMSVDFEFEK